MRVIDLMPGDRLNFGDEAGTLLVQTPHPLYPGLQLVIWYLHGAGVWSFDALSPGQQLHGELVDAPLGLSTPTKREAHLREILHGTKGMGVR
jgi:hypothetical protein